MEYRLDVTDKVKGQIAALPPEVAETVPGHPDRLAAAPVTLSIPGAPPAQPVGREFKAAAGALKRMQRLIRQTEALLRSAEHEATRRKRPCLCSAGKAFCS